LMFQPPDGCMLIESLLPLYPSIVSDLTGTIFCTYALPAICGNN
jgi:hypothetical protein